MMGEIAAKVAEFVGKISETVEKTKEITGYNEVSESTETGTYMDIKPENPNLEKDADKFWNDMFSDDLSGLNEDDNVEDTIEKALDDYFDDLKDRSECPDTLEDKPFEVDDLEKQTPEKTAEMRDEFDDLKVDLKKEWAEKYDRPWPKYDHDIYSSNEKLIRKTGSDYDAHHIHPLGMGGKNEVSNITPLNAEAHYDKQGVHAPDSPYSRMDKILGGID